MAKLPGRRSDNVGLGGRAKAAINKENKGSPGDRAKVVRDRAVKARGEAIKQEGAKTSWRKPKGGA